MTRFLALIAALLVALISGSADATAGAQPGPGLINVIESTLGEISQAMERRHEIALERAFENEEFQSLLDEFYGEVAYLVGDELGLGHIAAASKFESAVEEEILRIEYASENGIDFKFLNHAVRDALELFVDGVEATGAIPKGTGFAVSALKVDTAFATAYVDAFFTAR